MVGCSAEIHLVSTHHPPFFILILFFLITLCFAAPPLSFNFTGFAPNDGKRIYYERAYPADGTIQLVTNQNDLNTAARVGRATYMNPMQLWDKASRNLTDFTTYFSFTINSQGSTTYGDGLTFFLAPAGSRLPINPRKGGSLALTNQPLNSTGNQFVAVEFDIFQDPEWDPEREHVGIDINSLQSATNVTWWATDSILEGRRNEAWVSYNSSSKNLSVVFTGLRNNATVYQNLSYIVDLRDYLPDQVTFGFSAATGKSATAVHRIHAWSFNSTLGMVEVKVNSTNPAVAGPASTPAPSPNKMVIIVGVVVGGSVVIGVLGLALFSLCKKKAARKDEAEYGFDEVMNDEFEKGTGPKRFSYKELARATNNFGQQEKLGEGGFGGVYRGFFKESKSYVAIKRISSGSKQGVKEYASEVKVISRLRHKNLVQLIGWCHEKKGLLLVYEFLSNGSLDYHLFKGKSMLPWEVRYKIAQGLASALLYLHEEWEQCVVHRDIKSSNVMLDSNFNAKLGDFGLARFVDHEKGAQTTMVAGTMGYLAPEYFATGQASRESDTYSFGVLALEIACGRKPIDPKYEGSQMTMVEWVWDLYGSGNIFEAADPNLSEDFNQEQMERLMIVGLWCAHPDRHFRPSIKQALHVLNFEAPLPVLPENMPVATYLTASAINLLSSQASAFGATPSQSTQIKLSSYNDGTDSSKFTTSSEASSTSTSLLIAR
ncbi:hypothetical protein RJ639_014327 [Escallonia herrerae]|uniref:Protein kinase domain-containing protein n=1 Tax=Escallonia herrerae TaxID=1293975 RepID=A0AA89AM40_9ASTE|nr:hypothetical protein RJ639_014327 [Escallonia herrerae]